MFFATHARLCRSHTPALKELINKLTQNNHVQSSLQTESKRYAGQIFEKIQFTVDERTYRILLKDTSNLTFSSKQNNEIAFTLELEEVLTDQSYGKIQTLIDLQTAQNITQSSGAKAGYNSIFNDEEVQKKSDTISSANVLSWNRLLKDAYQGNALSGSSSGSGASSSGKSESGGGKSSGYGAAASMAKCSTNVEEVAKVPARINRR